VGHAEARKDNILQYRDPKTAALRYLSDFHHRQPASMLLHKLQNSGTPPCQNHCAEKMKIWQTVHLRAMDATHSCKLNLGGGPLLLGAAGVRSLSKVPRSEVVREHESVQQYGAAAALGACGVRCPSCRRTRYLLLQLRQFPATQIIQAWIPEAFSNLPVILQGARRCKASPHRLGQARLTMPI